jgi:hypothetical protein
LGASFGHSSTSRGPVKQIEAEGEKKKKYKRFRESEIRSV